jgi:hypothetical protein
MRLRCRTWLKQLCSCAFPAPSPGFSFGRSLSQWPAPPTRSCRAPIRMRSCWEIPYGFIPPGAAAKANVFSRFHQPTSPPGNATGPCSTSPTFPGSRTMARRFTTPGRHPFCRTRVSSTSITRSVLRIPPLPGSGSRLVTPPQGLFRTLAGRCSRVETVSKRSIRWRLPIPRREQPTSTRAARPLLSLLQPRRLAALVLFGALRDGGYAHRPLDLSRCHSRQR